MVNVVRRKEWVDAPQHQSCQWWPSKFCGPWKNTDESPLVCPEMYRTMETYRIVELTGNHQIKLATSGGGGCGHRD
jgi:hypothetical protein